jgi:hypothetical protein
VGAVKSIKNAAGDFVEVNIFNRCGCLNPRVIPGVTRDLIGWGIADQVRNDVFCSTFGANTPGEILPVILLFLLYLSVMPI